MTFRFRMPLYAIALLAMLVLAVRPFSAEIGVHPSQRYYTDSKGKPVFLMGYYFWGSVVDGEFIDHPSSYHAIMDLGQPYGINYIRISLGINRFTATTDPKSWNNQPSSTPFVYVNNKADLDQWNDAFWNGNQGSGRVWPGTRIHRARVHFRRLSTSRPGTKAFRWTNSFWNRDNQVRDFFGDLDIDNDNTADEDGNFWRAADFINNTGVGVYQRKMIDKTIAEVGSYDNVMFELGNETFGANAAVRTAMIDYIRTKTSKVITVGQKDIETITTGTGDGAAQHIAASAADLKVRIANFVGKGWPAWEDPDGNPLVGASADELRRSAWYSLAGGAAGWGGFTYDFNSFGTGLDVAKATYYQNLLRFLDTSGVKFWKMIPNHSLVNSPLENSCLEDEGKEYLVYVLNRSTATLDLTDLQGGAHFRLYNPKTHVFSAVQSVGGGMVRTFNRPAGAEDWVIHVTKKNGKYDGWSNVRTWDGANSAASGDPDSDSASNLLEYALGLDPLVADPISKLPQFSMDTTSPDGPWLALTYRKNTSATDIAFAVAGSTDLVNWTPLAVDGENVVEEIADADEDGDNSAALIRVLVKQQPGVPRQFLRLQVSSASGDYSAWSISQSWSNADDSFSGNPDSDGLSNRLEYAMDLDPLAQDSPDKIPRAGVDMLSSGGPWATYTYRRNTRAADLYLTVGTSTDLSHWTRLHIDGKNAVQEIANADPGR